MRRRILAWLFDRYMRSLEPVEVTGSPRVVIRDECLPPGWGFVTTAPQTWAAGGSFTVTYRQV